MNSCRNFILAGRELLQDAFLRLFKIGASLSHLDEQRIYQHATVLTDESVDPDTLANISIVHA